MKKIEEEGPAPAAESREFDESAGGTETIGSLNHRVGVFPDLNDRVYNSLKGFMPSDERMLWTGRPQLSRLVVRALSLSAAMLFVAAVGLYFVFRETTIIDLCGTHPTRACSKLYFWPWMGLFAAAIYTPLLWLSLFAHATGLLQEAYGLTDKRAIKLRSNPFDRFQSVKFGKSRPDQIAVKRLFGTVKFGHVAFLCLSNSSAEMLRKSTQNHANLTGTE